MAAKACPLLCRFLDAGDNETLRTLYWPAFKKRQGTKSREVGHRLGSERYGDLNVRGLANDWFFERLAASNACTT
jgi:hypothetical protein